MSQKNNKPQRRASLAARILCIVLAFLMVSGLATSLVYALINLL